MKMKSLLTWLCVVGSSIGLSAYAERAILLAQPSNQSASLPLEAQYAVSAALGKDQTAYHILPNHEPLNHAEKSYQAANPNQHFDVRFAAQGASVVNNGIQWNLRVQAWGYGDPDFHRRPPVADDGGQTAEGFAGASPLLAELSAGGGSACGGENTTAAAPLVSANRVEYQRGALTEWYVNGPLGLQQGFIVKAPPSAAAHRGPGRAPLTFVLNLPGGGGQVKVDADRTGLTLLTRSEASERADKMEPSLRYSGLTALDADGRRLRAWLEPKENKLLVCVDDRGARYPIIIDPFIQQAKLTAAGGAASDLFGVSVALSSDGNTAIAGAYVADVGGNADQGVAYVFTRSGTAWSQQAKLIASDGAASDSFGVSVALSSDGNTAIAGARYADVGGNPDQGAAYVFTRSGDFWVQQVKLIAADGAASDYFGNSVALSSDGNTAIAGAYGADVGGNADQGAAYVFTRSGSAWSQQAKLTASDGAVLDLFGVSVALSSDGNTAIAGATRVDVGGNANQGAAYVFTRSGSSWSQQVRLIAGDGAALDLFGVSVALSSDGNTAIVGAYYADVGGNVDQGAAYVFTRSGTAWTQQAKLLAAGGAASDLFGVSVALSSDGNTAIAGAYGADVGGNADQGVAYVFTRSGAAWSQQAKLTSSDGVAADFFGISVALSGDGNTICTGAYGADVGGNANQGAAYVFAVCTLQFAESAYSVSEDAGSVTVTVTRANSTAGVVSVSFQTTNGTALAGTDYTATNGALTWADGNADNQTITIPILNRPGTQASRAFTVNLSGASGASLGSPAVAAVTIIDSGTPSAPTGVSASDDFYIDRVRVSWDAAAGATGYEVWRGASNDTSQATNIGTGISGTNYDDMAAFAGWTYYYWVKTTNASGVSAFSASAIGRLLFGPDVRLNGAAGPVTMAVGSQLVVTVSINPTPYYMGNPADWWVLYYPGYGIYYLNSGLTWSWASTIYAIQPGHQGGLFGLQSAVVLDTTFLPTGIHTFYFGVDILNGFLDSTVVYDSATVTVAP